VKGLWGGAPEGKGPWERRAVPKGPCGGVGPLHPPVTAAGGATNGGGAEACGGSTPGRGSVGPLYPPVAAGGGAPNGGGALACGGGTPGRGGGPTSGRTNGPPAANGEDAPGSGGAAVASTKAVTGRPGPAGLSFPIGGCIA
jgi:hypothetical protein